MVGILLVKGYFPFAYLVVSLHRLGYLKAVSTSCWQTVGNGSHFRSIQFFSLQFIIHSVVCNVQYNINNNKIYG